MEGLRELIDIDEKNVEHRTHDVIIVFANDGLLRTSYEKIPVHLFRTLLLRLYGLLNTRLKKTSRREKIDAVDFLQILFTDFFLLGSKDYRNFSARSLFARSFL